MRMLADLDIHEYLQHIPELHDPNKLIWVRGAEDVMSTFAVSVQRYIENPNRVKVSMQPPRTEDLIIFTSDNSLSPSQVGTFTNAVNYVIPESVKHGNNLITRQYENSMISSVLHALVRAYLHNEQLSVRELNTLKAFEALHTRHRRKGE